MKLPLWCFALATLAAATPASATGGLECKSAGPRPLRMLVGFGHVPGAPLILTRLEDNGRNIEVTAPQWWFDRWGIRLLLVDKGGLREELLLKAADKNGHWDGSVWRNGLKRWVRCYEN
jgi:hypothetical protein